MFVVFTLLLLFHFSIAFDPRFRRFLNSEVHNRINVLDQSHSTHRNETDWMRTIFLAIAIGFGLILLLVFLTIVYLCRRIRRHVQETQSPTLAAVEHSGLSHLHPIIPPLLGLLQHQTNLPSTSSTSVYAQSAYPHSTIYPSTLPTLKF